MTTKLIDHLKSGRPISAKLVKEIVAELEKAQLAVATERERCAMLCEEEAENWRNKGQLDTRDFELCAARIRAADKTPFIASLWRTDAPPKNRMFLARIDDYPWWHVCYYSPLDDVFVYPQLACDIFFEKKKDFYFETESCPETEITAWMEVPE